MTGDIPRQFASNVNFSSSNLDLLGSRRPAHVSVKQEYPYKSGDFTDIGSSSVKTVAYRHKYAAYHNKY